MGRAVFLPTPVVKGVWCWLYSTICCYPRYLIGQINYNDKLEDTAPMYWFKRQHRASVLLERIIKCTHYKLTYLGTLTFYKRKVSIKLRDQVSRYYMVETNFRRKKQFNIEGSYQKSDVNWFAQSDRMDSNNSCCMPSKLTKVTRRHFTVGVESWEQDSLLIWVTFPARLIKDSLVTTGQNLARWHARTPIR